MKKLLFLLLLPFTISAIGKITVFTGPMFAKKSTNLIKLYNKYTAQQKLVTALKPYIDTRTQGTIASHNGVHIPAHIINAMHEVREYCLAAEVVIVDEVQFFDEGIIDTLAVLRDLGKRVYVAGLDMDYRRNDFRITKHLLCLANTIVQLSSHCTYKNCNGIAHYTQRLVNGKPAPFDGDTIAIGGAESYQPRCVFCYNEERQ